MRLRNLRSVFLPLALALPLSVLAGPFSSLFVFGDSLSDTGNLIGSGVQRPVPFAGPYDGGRFSNGSLWIEDVAQGLGLTGQAASYSIGGNNYAFAGSQTGTLPPVPQDQIPGLQIQSMNLWGASHTAADPNALYVVVAGGNDMRAARSTFSSSSDVDEAGRLAAAMSAIANLETTIGYLASLGAHNFLVASVPDLGLTPEAILLNLAAASSDATAKFNALMPSVVEFGNGLGLSMNFLDLAALNDDIVNHPDQYGITNTTSPCAGFMDPSAIGGVGTTSCDTSLFSDVLHPSAYTHSLIAAAALEVLGIPEPTTAALFFVGFLALLISRRRKSN
jgi:phospholipase/lecithinase/hemolysin